MGMKFEVENEPSQALKVKVEQDCSDVDIVVTLPNGNEATIGFLNEDGLTLCELSPQEGLELNGDNYIKHQYDN